MVICFQKQNSIIHQSVKKSIKIKNPTEVGLIKTILFFSLSYPLQKTDKKDYGNRSKTVCQNIEHIGRPVCGKH